MDASTHFLTKLKILSKTVLAEIGELAKVEAQEGRESPFVRSLASDLLKLKADINQLFQDTRSNLQPLQIRRLALLQQRATTLFGESMLVRLSPSIKASFNDRICELSDRLLIELSRAVNLELPQYTTLATADSYGSSSRIIRLRYPASLWDLPVAAHEFAHSFGPMWRTSVGVDTLPRDTFIGNRRLGSRLVNDEYLCDLIATYLIGPAYTAACIMNRFNPINVNDTETHPSDLKRGWWVLRGLELLASIMPDDGDSARYNAILSRLQILWTKYVAATTEPGDAVVPTEELELAIQSLFPRLQADLPAAVLSDLSGVFGLMADYKDRSEPRDRISIRDLLNAIWFLRLDLGDSEEIVRSIEQWATTVTTKSFVATSAATQ